MYNVFAEFFSVKKSVCLLCFSIGTCHLSIFTNAICKLHMRYVLEKEHVRLQSTAWTHHPRGQFGNVLMRSTTIWCSHPHHFFGFAFSLERKKGCDAKYYGFIVHSLTIFLMQLHFGLEFNEKTSEFVKKYFLFIVEIIAEMSIRCAIIRNIRGTASHPSSQIGNRKKWARRSTFGRAVSVSLCVYSRSLSPTMHCVWRCAIQTFFFLHFSSFWWFTFHLISCYFFFLFSASHAIC